MDWICPLPKGILLTRTIHTKLTGNRIRSLGPSTASSYALFWRKKPSTLRRTDITTPRPRPGFSFPCGRLALPKMEKVRSTGLEGWWIGIVRTSRPMVTTMRCSKKSPWNAINLRRERTWLDPRRTFIPLRMAWKNRLPPPTTGRHWSLCSRPVPIGIKIIPNRSPNRSPRTKTSRNRQTSRPIKRAAARAPRLRKKLPPFPAWRVLVRGRTVNEEGPGAKKAREVVGQATAARVAAAAAATAKAVMVEATGAAEVPAQTPAQTPAQILVHPRIPNRTLDLRRARPTHRVGQELPMMGVFRKALLLPALMLIMQLGKVKGLSRDPCSRSWLPSWECS